MSEETKKETGFKGTTFVIKKAKGSVMLPALDENGNPMQKTFNGNKVFTASGQKVFIMKAITFSPIVVDVARGTYCQYIAKDKQEEDYLQAKRKDPNSGVITKKDYEKELNPEATKVKDELAKVKAAAREKVDKLKGDNAAKTEALKKQSQEIADLKKKLGAVK